MHYLPLLIAPLCLFFFPTKSSQKLQIARLLVPILLTYLALFGILYWQHYVASEAINLFNSTHPECALNPCTDTPKPYSNGPLLGVFWALGWIPAIAYVGLWEILRILRLSKTGLSAKKQLPSLLAIILAVLLAYPAWKMLIAFYR